MHTRDSTALQVIPTHLPDVCTRTDLVGNSADSFSCLKICSCRRNSDSLCEVFEDSFGSTHWAPVRKTLPYLQLLNAAAFLKSARRATRAAEAEDMLALQWQRVKELSTGGQQHTAGRTEHKDHSHSCSPKSSCFRVLVPGTASSHSCSCDQLFWVTAWQAQSK